jgi:hypothetical protein
MRQLQSVKAPLQLPPAVSSGSGRGDTPASSSSFYSPSEPPYSVIGVSIGKAQTRLASPTTPAAVKAAAIEEGDGYFSLPAGAAGSPDTSPIPESSPNTVVQVSGSSSASDEPPKPKSRSSHYGAIRSPSALRRSSSTGSLSFHRAMSTASSLGDDTRFENVREQINNRFKAIKDSLQDSNFRLPNLPSLPSLPSLPKIPNLLQPYSKVSDPRSRRYTYDTSQRSIRFGADPPKNGKLDKDPAPHATAGMKASVVASHPYFTKALDQLTGDLVILGGYRGSILRTTEAPHRRLWVPPISAALNLTKVDLEVGLEDEDEDKMHESIEADGMLTHVGPIDVARRLFRRLRASDNAQNGTLRVHEYAYDWRLSPHRLSADLIKFLERLPCNQPGQSSTQSGATVIAHSLGGLITRYGVNHRPELFAGVVYAGTPNHCVNILGPLRHGDEVMWSSKILTAQVNFTVRTSFALLPLDGKCFVDIDTKEELPVDFFNLEDWIKYRFSPCIEPTLPAKSTPSSAKPSIIDSITQLPRSVGGTIMDNIPILGRRKQQQQQRPKSPDENAAEASGAVLQMNSNKQDTQQQSSSTTTPTNSSTNRKPLLSVPGITTPPPPLPHDAAVAYLSRTLARTKAFKQSLAFNPSLSASNSYPPMSVIYGKTEPTVCGAGVHGYDGISRADAYDSLVFASGDGVVLARAAMLPEGYRAAQGGVVGSDRGHISLLGDLEAVGKCLMAVMRARRKGVGLGSGNMGGGKVDGKECEGMN